VIDRDGTYIGEWLGEEKCGYGIFKWGDGAYY
jgi:hypothetical protein